MGDMKVSRKGQVTIPRAIRERFGLFPGTDVEFLEENDKVVIKKAFDQPSRGEEGICRLRQVHPRVHLGTDALLTLLRG